MQRPAGIWDSRWMQAAFQQMRPLISQKQRRKSIIKLNYAKLYKFIFDLILNLFTEFFKRGIYTRKFFEIFDG